MGAAAARGGGGGEAAVKLGNAVGAVVVHSVSSWAPLDANSSGPDVNVTGPAAKHAASSLQRFNTIRQQQKHTTTTKNPYIRMSGSVDVHAKGQ